MSLCCFLSSVYCSVSKKALNALRIYEYGEDGASQGTELTKAVKNIS